MDSLYNDFDSFKKALAAWLLQKPKSLFINGTNGTKPPGQIYTGFKLDLGDQTIIISFHADTTIDACQKILTKKLAEFAILPPASNKKYYRFEFLDSIHLATTGHRNGLYAYAAYTKINKTQKTA